MTWGKLSKTDGTKLPLLVHQVDVAECFRMIIQTPVQRAIVQTLTDGNFNDIMLERLCVLCFLHDVGKINNGFQAKAGNSTFPLKAGHVGEALLLLQSSRLAIANIRGALGLPEMEKWGRGFFSLFRASIAHHGRPISENQAVRRDDIWLPYTGHDPVAAAHETATFLRVHYPLAFTENASLEASPELQHHFAGLVALADQIGSREDRFPLGRSLMPDLVVQSRQTAAAFLEDLRLDTAAVRYKAATPTPDEMFGWPAGTMPKPMQCALRDLPLNHRLVVLESETGSGKTEAALLRFHRLFKAGDVDAIYFAVPTRAAASGLHARIDRAMRTVFDEAAILALPGYLKIGTAEGKALPGWQVSWDDDPDAKIKASRWAAEAPRRFLAAFAAVGTVDQAMLAGLQVKWAHFRATALSRALLVVDEVHASDSYMQAVLSGVVKAHVERGGHALLMSATLGGAARAKWLGGPRAKPAKSAPYPVITWWEANQEQMQPLVHDGRRKAIHFQIEPWIAGHESIARHALAIARQGARVLVLRNTVREVIAVQQAILALDSEAPVLRVHGIPAPHHGRFASEDRRLLDAAVEATFGKQAPLGPAIAVGSQTLEQSLDICADYLVTDLCPVDVLLQRLGRLHRHDRKRPVGFEAARCLILTPPALLPDGSLRRFGLGANKEGHGVYPDIVGLEATRRLIIERPVWNIPDDNRGLVEAGTDPETLRLLAESLEGKWLDAQRTMQGIRMAHGQSGRFALIDRSKAFDGRSELFPDDENILTRLGGERFLLTFPEGTIGPFGTPISQIALPGHLLTAADAAGPVQVRPVEGGVRLQAGKATFVYWQTGLERQ